MTPNISLPLQHPRQHKGCPTSPAALPTSTYLPDPAPQASTPPAPSTPRAAPQGKSTLPTFIAHRCPQQWQHKPHLGTDMGPAQLQAGDRSGWGICRERHSFPCYRLQNIPRARQGEKCHRKPALLLSCISTPTQRQGSVTFSFRSFFLKKILFLFFCPPKFGMKENGVNKHFGRLLQPCSSWFMAWLGWRGKLPSPAQCCTGAVTQNTSVPLSIT